MKSFAFLTALILIAITIPAHADDDLSCNMEHAVFKTVEESPAELRVSAEHLKIATEYGAHVDYIFTLLNESGEPTHKLKLREICGNGLAICGAGITYFDTEEYLNGVHYGLDIGNSFRFNKEMGRADREEDIYYLIFPELYSSAHYFYHAWNKLSHEDQDRLIVPLNPSSPRIEKFEDIDWKVWGKAWRKVRCEP